MTRSDSFYDDVWNDASTYTKSYFDDQSDYEDTFVRNSMVASVCCIIEGAIYVIQFLMMLALVASLSYDFKLPVKHSMPKPENHGYDEMEVQPFIVVKGTIKKKKSKAKKKEESKNNPQDIQPIGQDVAPPGVGINPFENQPLGPGDQMLPPGPRFEPADVGGRNAFQQDEYDDRPRFSRDSRRLDAPEMQRFSSTQQYQGRPISRGNPNLDKIQEERLDDQYDQRYPRQDDRRGFGRRSDFDRRNNEDSKSYHGGRQRDDSRSGYDRPSYDDYPERSRQDDRYSRPSDLRKDDSYYGRPSNPKREEGRYQRSDRGYDDSRYDDPSRHDDESRYDDPSRYDNQSRYDDQSEYDDRSRYSRSQGRSRGGDNREEY